MPLPGPLSLVPTGRAWLVRSHMKPLTLELAQVFVVVPHYLEVDCIISLPSIDLDPGGAAAEKLRLIHLPGYHG